LHNYDESKSNLEYLYGVILMILMLLFAVK